MDTPRIDMNALEPAQKRVSEARRASSELAALKWNIDAMPHWGVSVQCGCGVCCKAPAIKAALVALAETEINAELAAAEADLRAVMQAQLNRPQAVTATVA